MPVDEIADKIINIATERQRRIECLLNCVNLNLDVINAAYDQGNDVSKQISKIATNLPDGFRRNTNDNINFHSFVVSHYFITLIAEFEGFLVDMLRSIVKRYPEKVGNISIKVSELTACCSLDEAIYIGIDRFINELTYKRPKEYIDTLQRIFSLNKEEFEALWPEFMERKARRDLGVHNDWRKNEIYVRKVKEVGITPSKDDFLAPDNEYFVDSVKVVFDLLAKISVHCAEKFRA
jgi:hypothetical protein